MPLLVYQIWKKSDAVADTNNKWLAYAWNVMQAGGVINYGLLALAFIASFMWEFNIAERMLYALLSVVNGVLI